MKIKATILIFILMLLILNCGKHKEAPQSTTIGLKFIRETLIEARPWQRPYYLPLRFKDYYYGFTNDPENKDGIIEQFEQAPWKTIVPMVDYFWALNSGELVFINKSRSEIFILNYETNRYLTFCPPLKQNENLEYLWVSPRDELYLGIYSTPPADSNITENLRIAKYTRKGPDFVFDSTFNPIALRKYLFTFRVAPSGDIYIKGWSGCKNRIWPIATFNEMGKFIECGCAEGVIGKGNYFNFNKGLSLSPNTKLLFPSYKDSILAKSMPENPLPGPYNFKSTFNNLIIAYSHRDYRQVDDSGRTFLTDLPGFVVFDPEADTGIEINLDENLNCDYEYFNVSDVSINYNGDIYALFVYFDKPGKITGNELIVLYRWRRGDSVKL